MSTTLSQPASVFPPPRFLAPGPWMLPIFLLVGASILFGLTSAVHPSTAALMQRCVLMDEKLSRIWSVANLEVGMAYLGIFGSMTFYIFQAARTDRSHLRDLGLGFAYLGISFAVDLMCVRVFEPFAALFIGNIVIMVFALSVSRQLWFQRLLGVFVPLVFLTCAVGHTLEGLSLWNQTYHVNVPWTMVTADIGFAVLVNAARFPTFIRGSGSVAELYTTRREVIERSVFLRDVLRIVTENRFFFCTDKTELPPILVTPVAEPWPLKTLEDVPTARRLASQKAEENGFGAEAAQCVMAIVGEGAVNAIRHGNGGTMTLSYDESAYQIRIEDSGGGIPLQLLPRAVLEPGFSTVETAGQGFMLMLNMADRTDMLTGTSGTCLVFTMYKQVPSRND